MYTPFYKDKNRISNKTDLFFLFTNFIGFMGRFIEMEERRWTYMHRDGQSSVNKRTLFISMKIPLPEG